MRLTLPLCLVCLGAVILSGCVEKVAEQPSGPPPGGEMINKPAPQPTMGGGAGGQAKLTLFTWTEVDELEVNERMCKDFEAENPNVKVDVINVSGSKDAMQKLETMFATKAGPDVMSIHGAYYVGFAEAGALMDLEQLAKDDADFRLDDIHPRLVDLCRYQGKLYSLPRYTSVYALFYNKAMFDAAGLPYPGTGEWTINGRTLEGYFPNKVHQQIVREPLTILELDGAYDVLVRVHGGGPSGQAGAVRLGVARSLNGVDPDLNRPALKKAGFLTRDARVPERKKAGLKKARKAPQYSKR